MTPTRLQYFFAGPWLWRCWMAGWALTAVVMAVWASGIRPSTIAAQPLTALWLVLIVPLAGALGVVGGVFPGVLILGPLFHARGVLNGAPFAKGDAVILLAPAHRDRTVLVYDVWAERNQVRVDLGPEARHACTDVFSYTEVCRAPTPPVGDPTGSA